MTRHIYSRRSIGMIAVFGIILAISTYAHAEEKKTKHRLPSGLYIELSEELMESIDQGLLEDTTIYMNPVSDQYLKQIAVSTDRLVETNNQIIQQQEKMIQLLEALLAKPKS